MNIKEKNTVVISSILAVVVCLVMAVGFQQLQSSKVKAQSQANLTLDVSTAQRKYLLLEPIPISFKLTNRTDSPVKWQGILAIGRDINFLARRQDGAETKWIGRRRTIDQPIYSPIETPPGGNNEAANLMSGELSEELFPSPGRYRLQVEFTYFDYSSDEKQYVTIVSEPITIDIEEPKGVNLKAYDYLKNTYEPVNESGNVREKIKLRQYFTDNFSESVYWKYMVYDSGSSYLRLLKDYEKAEREFLKIANIDFYYSKETRKGLDEAGKKLGKNYPNLKDMSPAPPPFVQQVPQVMPAMTPGPASRENIPVPIRIPNPDPKSFPETKASPTPPQ